MIFGPANIIHVSGYPRSKPRRHRLEQDVLYNEFVDLQCAAALERALSEPLDAIDEPEDWKQKQREVM